MKKVIIISVLTVLILGSCKKDTKTTTATTTTNPPAAPQLKFVFKFDSTQVRLNNVGMVSTIPANHKTQSPRFNTMSSHYVELAPDSLSAVGTGCKIYTTPTVPYPAGTYTDAIDFSQSVVVSQGQVFASKPLSQITPGTYKWIRVSLAYQNYDINYSILSGTQVSPTYTLSSQYNGTGTIASFIGYNTYITSYKIKTQSVTVNAAKLQGYWGFESPYVQGGVTYTTTVITGQSASGATTVVDPAATTIGVPAGSCLVTGKFVGPTGSTEPLVITGNETQDIVVTISLSTNNSFEWVEHTGDSNYNPANGDTVTDMGIRGLIPKLPH